MTDPAPQHPRPAAVVVLAAGSGTRMKSKLMKVLHPVGGRSMIGHVLTAALHVEPAYLVAVVGNSREQVGPHILEQVPSALLAVQETQDGTGHAVRIALDALRAAAGTTDGVVVVMAGDTPLMEGETLTGLVEAHAAAGRAVTVLTAEVPEPFGYGRILRDDGGGGHRDRGGEGGHGRAGGRARDQQRHLRLRRGLPGRRAGPDHQRQRQGRVLPHRRGAHRPPGRPGRRGAPDRRRDADRGRQRPRPAGRPRRRAEPPGAGPLDARRGDRGGPGDHLDRRRRGAGARRDDPAGRPAARRHGGRRGRGRSAPTARSRTSRSDPARRSSAPTASWR